MVKQINLPKQKLKLFEQMLKQMTAEHKLKFADGKIS